MSPHTPRVLLLEDDPSIRRFVALALAGLQIELLQAESIAQAKATLALGGVSLLIADLMLPDGNGMDLLAEVQADRARHAAMRTLVFSAGVSAALREQATLLGAWGVLEKPVALSALLQCVQQSLSQAQDELPTTASAEAAAEVGVYIDPAQRQLAIDTHFGGRASLFDAFMMSCVDQLPADVLAGDEACAAGNAVTMRRVAHNLKAVLHLIGALEGHEAARHLETACAAGAPMETVAAHWHEVRRQVAAVGRPAGNGTASTAASF